MFSSASPMRTAAHGSASSADPTCTAVAPALRKECASAAVAIPPHATTGAGSMAHTLVTASSTSGRMAGPESRPCSNAPVCGSGAQPVGGAAIVTASAPASITARAVAIRRSCKGSLTSSGSRVTARTAATTLAAELHSSSKMSSMPAMPSTPSSAVATSR